LIRDYIIEFFLAIDYFTKKLIPKYILKFTSRRIGNLIQEASHRANNVQETSDRNGKNDKSSKIMDAIKIRSF